MEKTRTIKISDNNYKWLLKISSDLQKKKEKKISFDDALKELAANDGKKNSIMNFAGKLELSEKDSKNMIEEIYKERKIASRRLQ